jgi:hypothetical protein
MTTLPISPRQAGYLNNVADAARYYKKSCEEIKYSADRDLARLKDNHQPVGPNHQVMFEHVKYYGQLEALLQQAFMIFDPSTFSNDQAEKEAYVTDVNSWLAIAIADPTDDDYRVWFQSDKDDRFSK